jgi:hypothetical protein
MQAPVVKVTQRRQSLGKYMKICKKDPMTSYIMYINKVSRLMVQVTEVIEKCHREVKIKIETEYVYRAI